MGFALVRQLVRIMRSLSRSWCDASWLNQVQARAFVLRGFKDMLAFDSVHE